MSELGEAIAEVVEEAGESRLGTVVALLVALAATFMALASVKDRNLTLGMARAQAKAVDTWNQYQAKSMKQNLAEATLDELLAMQDVSDKGAPPPHLGTRIQTYRGQVARYEHEKEELKTRAEADELEYEALNVRHDQFDLSEAAISVAIALLGVTALTKKRWLLGVAGVFLALGLLFGAAGFLNWNIHADALVSWLA
jgi:hypothetical protein